MEGVSSFLRQAAAEESSLTRSFWYGRFLQALPSGSLEACYQELQAGAEGATQIAVADGGAPPCKHLYSQVMCGETLLQHVRDATECLSTHETSLSPGVFDLITTSVLRPPDDVGTPSVSDILTQGYSLNWPILAEYFKGTITTVHTVASSPPARTTHCQFAKNSLQFESTHDIDNCVPTATSVVNCFHQWQMLLLKERTTQLVRGSVESWPGKSTSRCLKWSQQDSGTCWSKTSSGHPHQK